MNRFRWVMASFACGAIACGPLHVDRQPAAPVPVPEGFVGEAGDAPLPETWWTEFDDPQLTALVTRSLERNFSLQGAWARLQQAEALARQAGAQKWPGLQGTASASYSKNRFFFGEGLPMGMGGDGSIETTQLQYNASLAASYEVDLFRRIANQTSAAEYEVAAARDDYEAMAITLAAQIAETWFQVLSQRELLVLLSEQLQTNRIFLELVDLRFQNGLVSAVDVYQQRQQVVASEGLVAQAQAQLVVAETQLAVLAGEVPRRLQLDDTNALPTLPQPPTAGLPAQLLTRRPDLRALRRRLVAVDFRVAAAYASLLPSLRLTGSGGNTATSFGDLFASPIWNLMANLTVPLWDGGARRAVVSQTQARQIEVATQYGEGILRAMKEVEDALYLEKQQLTFIEKLAEQVELADITVRETRARYRSGLTDFLPVLTALNRQQGTQQQLVNARRQLLAYRVQLYRALGGTWTRELERPDAYETRKEQQIDD